MTSLPYPVNGTITDSDSSAVVTKVVLRNDRTGEKISVVSNSLGQYVMDAANLASGYMDSDRITIIVGYGDEEGESSILISSQTHEVNIETSVIEESSDVTYCKVQDVLDELGDKTTDDISYERIRKTILRAESEIDERSGTKFASTTVTDEIYDFDQYTSYKSAEQLRGYSSDILVGTRQDSWNTFFNDKIVFENKPVISITSLSKNNAGPGDTDNWESLTEQTGTGGDYTIYKDIGVLKFIKNAPPIGARKIKTTYIYGYSTVPKIVEKLAILISVKSILQSTSNSSMFDSPDSISLEGISISKGTGGSVSYITNLTNEINQLWKNVGEFVNNIA